LFASKGYLLIEIKSSELDLVLFIVLHEVLRCNLLLYSYMEPWLNLLDETITHFNEGAKSVKAYTNNTTYIITRSTDSAHYWVAVEEANFQKTKTTSLDDYFKEVFGIEAIY
jgi:hypothetical protein